MFIKRNENSLMLRFICIFKVFGAGSRNYDILGTLVMIEVNNIQNFFNVFLILKKHMHIILMLSLKNKGWVLYNLIFKIIFFLKNFKFNGVDSIFN